jgi:cytochrome c-type biogenesis protein CcmF
LNFCVFSRVQRIEAPWRNFSRHGSEGSAFPAHPRPPFRSGVLTSVHAFASDPMRGIFILAILVLFIGGGFALFAWRAPLLKQGGLFAPISREGALVLNNLFLVVACGAVFFGTLYPLIRPSPTCSVPAPRFGRRFRLLPLGLHLRRGTTDVAVGLRKRYR